MVVEVFPPATLSYNGPSMSRGSFLLFPGLGRRLAMVKVPGARRKVCTIVGSPLCRPHKARSRACRRAV